AFGDFALIRRAGAPVLLAAADVGPEVAQSVAAFFAQPHNRDVIDALFANGIVIDDVRAPDPAFVASLDTAFLLSAAKRLGASFDGVGEESLKAVGQACPKLEDLLHGDAEAIADLSGVPLAKVQRVVDGLRAGGDEWA